jgi:hypothetical protein
VGLSCALIGFATLPLAWLRIAKLGGLNVGLFHLAFSAVCAFAVLGGKRSSWGRMVSANLLLVGAITVFIASTFLFVAIGQLPFRDFFRPLVYAIFSLSIAVLVVNARGDALRLLALTAALTVGVFLFSFLSIALQAGVPVIQYAVLSIQSGDPDILIFRVFRRVMLAGAEDNLDEVKANLRHEIGMGLLLAALVSVCFSKAITDTRALVIVYAASGVAILLAMLTLSRATIVIGVFVTVIVIFGKLASARSVNRGLSVVLSFSLLMTVALIFTPLGELVLARFAQAESCNQRSSAIVDSIAVIANNPVFPDDASSVYIRSGNSHIVLLEMWKYGGAAGAAAAALLFVALGVSLLQGLTGSEARGRATRHRSPDRLVASALLCFPIVRYLTAGSGLGITDWVAIGLALGCFTLGNASKTSYTDRGLTLRASTRSFHSPRSAS